MSSPSFVMPDAVDAYPVPYTSDVLVRMPGSKDRTPIRLSFQEAYRLRRDLQIALDTQAGWNGQPTSPEAHKA